MCLSVDGFEVLSDIRVMNSDELENVHLILHQELKIEDTALLPGAVFFFL